MLPWGSARSPRGKLRRPRPDRPAPGSRRAPCPTRWTWWPAWHHGASCPGLPGGWWPPRPAAGPWSARPGRWPRAVRSRTLKPGPDPWLLADVGQVHPEVRARGDRHLAEGGGGARSVTVPARDHIVPGRQREAERLVVVVADVLA